jgi:uncharacterized iron-regulated membrane protein
MRTGPAVLLIGGIAYSLIAASTTPFTEPANVLTALAILVMVVLAFVWWPLRTRAFRSVPAEPAPTTAAPGTAAPGTAAPGHPYRWWLVFVVVFAAWELFNYLVHGTRANHPTFSSITDAIDRFYLLKSLLFLAWMAACWVILRRGSRPPRSARTAKVEP